MADLNVRVDDDVLEQITELASASGMTVGEYVRALLAEAIKAAADDEIVEPSKEAMRAFQEQMAQMRNR